MSEKPNFNEKTASDEDTDSDTGRSKKKTIGAIAVEPKRAAGKQQSRESLWQRSGDQKKDTPEKSAPKFSINPVAERQQKPESIALLTPIEAQETTRQLAQARKAELAGDDEVAEEMPKSANAVNLYLAKAEELGDSQQARQETLAELGISESVEDLTPVENSPVASEFAPAETIIDPRQTGEGVLNIADTSAEDEEPTPPVSSGSGSGGSASGPPRGPIGSPASGAPGPPVPPAGGSGMYRPPSNAMQPNLAPAPGMVSADEAHYYERRAAGRGLLVGGIVGYLIGRRRGRIKTEKRLLPVQKKLEKQVEQLQTALLQGEQQVRAAARRSEAVTLPAAERIMAPTEQRRPAVEARQLHKASLPPERIGHVIVAAQTVERAKSPPVAKRLEAAEAASKQAESLSRAELLSLSEKIIVEGTSLRQVYETHLVSEKGLRRLVAEHLRGGNVQRVLRRELVEREIDFERDPLLRDRARASLAESGGGKAALDALLQEAGALPEIDSEDPVLKARAAHQQKTALKQKRQSVLVDVSLVSLIAVLLAIISLLLLRG